MSQIWHLLLLLCLSVTLGEDSTPCKFDASGVNVYVDTNLQVSKVNQSGLPELPDGTPTISYGHVHNCSRFKGILTVGGTLSMDPSDSYYGYSNQLRRSVQIFLDWLNDERGGIAINGDHYAMRFRWVHDASSKQQVTKAMAHALRADDGTGEADFAIAGYSSGLTDFATQQSAANGRIMLSGTASSPQVFRHNNLTFGTAPSAHIYLRSSAQAITTAAANFSKSGAGKSSNLRGTAGVVQNLKAGIIQADALFTKSACETVPEIGSAAGMLLSAVGTQTIEKHPQIVDVMNVLQRLQEDGVNVIFGCTYYDTGIAIISALERLDYSPYAVVMTATVATPGYSDLVARGWWQGEYFLGVASWHVKSRPVRGSFSKMTSSEFAETYRKRYNSEVGYQGASQFAACLALVAGIEAAGSLSTEKVAAALQELRIDEFFGRVGFNDDGQNNLTEMLGLQYASGAEQAEVVYPLSAVTKGRIAFPMPTWAQRRCRALGPGKTWKDSATVTKSTLAHECSGNGLCNGKGLCECDGGWSGASCEHRTTVEETGLPIWGTALLVAGIILIATCFVCALWWYKNRHIKQLRRALKDNMVSMRSVVADFTPGLDGTGTMKPAAPRPPQTEHAERAMWYWSEDPGRMSSHNASLTYPPNWIQYAGSVAAELEEAYLAFQAGVGPVKHATDLSDRISSTGTEAKAHGGDTGTKYSIDFQSMKQINHTSGFERDVLRRVVPTGEKSIGPASASVAPTPSITRVTTTPTTKPDELDVLLALKAGSIVQLSKQRPDGWAFGNVIYQSHKDDEMVVTSESISYDAGWFPLDCTAPPTKEAVKLLQDMVGSAGADCLTPPSSWAQLKDPLVAELITLPLGPEQQQAVDWFKKTLDPRVKVIKVERVQNISLWQSFAVKRQTLLSREGKAADDASADLERAWLFHGTTADIVPKIVQQGFNRSFCGRNATMYGKGVYFARDAAYSSSTAYSQPDTSGVQRMFLCRVLVGERCQGVKDMLAPSVRDEKRHVLYDTTVDNVRDPSIFVTYHDAQAYPEFLVHFTQ